MISEFLMRVDGAKIVLLSDVAKEEIRQGRDEKKARQ